jgi:hypothetical protein
LYRSKQIFLINYGEILIFKAILSMQIPLHFVFLFLFLLFCNKFQMHVKGKQKEQISIITTHEKRGKKEKIFSANKNYLQSLNSSTQRFEILRELFFLGIKISILFYFFHRFLINRYSLVNANQFL